MHLLLPLTKACSITISPVPRLLVGGEKKSLVSTVRVHSHNYLLLNTCSDKVGGERVILIHVIDSVTYNLASILVYNVQRRAKPHYSLNYTALIRYKFLLT